ncbi:uncharacterized protein si:ch211-199g17.2 isoform X2 [Hippocampus zosterae]|uniref:uncharacterized protein si:ch211-199g17.2 isoform X2 n=1 Tax=Hippocampus zosterae TaxID=109293 RepID=UPI00223E20E4|nr:uncharacterized protein si:ch211-199g17.2 isoform X2 [Hippocampus zosterae]
MKSPFVSRSLKSPRGFRLPWKRNSFFTFFTLLGGGSWTQTKGSLFRRPLLAAGQALSPDLNSTQHGTQRSMSSELFDSLKVYLNNSQRLQPIIGLRSITECVKAGLRGGGEAVYLCEVCTSRLSKCDIRNHIMGSLHRYNYTKFWYPNLLSNVKESGNDMSLLARPLMDIARVLEDKEGPGDIKLLEVEDAAFEMLKATSDSEAIKLSRYLMYGAAEPESPSNNMLDGGEEQDYKEEEHRVVTIVHKVAQLAEGDGSSWAEEITPSFGHTLRNRYKGKKPLIGLFRVTECVCEEDARTYCFLCHCCRARVDTRAFIHHVSSSSHVHSYLMETRRELVEAAGPNTRNHSQLMNSLAKKVEREDGRGDMEVVKAPQFLCGQLASKSYKWCIGRLWKSSHPTVHKRKKTKKPTFYHYYPSEGPRVKKQDGGVPGKSRVVFNVSLPLTEGSMLLKRTPFSQESPPFDPLDSDFYSEPTNPSEEDLSVVHYFHPARNHQGEHPIPASLHKWQTEVPVAREWFSSASAEWCDWSPTPVEKHKNTHQARPPTVATDMAGCYVPQTVFQTDAVMQTQSWRSPYRGGPGGFPEYLDYGAPPELHLPSLFHPASVPSHCSGPAWSKLTVQK